MAQAKECDRCGKLYRPYTDGCSAGEYNAIARMRVDPRGTVIYTTGPVELCEECMGKIRDFIWKKELQEDKSNDQT